MLDKDWLIEDWYPMGHRIMDTAVEGNCKTTYGCGLAVCIASGTDFLGQKVQQGSVIIVDEETPAATLEDKVSRFALGIGYKDWHELPIKIESMKGFRFARRSAMDWLLKIISKEQDEPMLLRMDSIIAMLPGFRQGMVENDSSAGIAIKDDLDKLLLFVKNISISAHAKKNVSDMLPKQMRSLDMQSMVRGHGGIVGEASDTGIVLKKISEYPEPTRFVMVTKSRRKAIPMSSQDVFVEMKEEKYGKGWARLERIDPIALPPTKVARDIYQFFNNGSKENTVSAETMTRKAAFYTRFEVKAGVEELIERKVLVATEEAFKFMLNPKIISQCEAHYLSTLNLSLPTKARQSRQSSAKQSTLL